jgi:hypothetical protein
MIFSIILRNRILVLISWSASSLLLLVSILVLQTRSLAIAVALGIIIAALTTFYIYPFGNLKNSEFYSLKFLKMLIAVFIIGIIAFSMYSWHGNFEPFLIRMQGALEPTIDGGIATRFDEVITVFSPMKIFDHVIGMGLSPTTNLTDLQGTPHSAMHFGLLNIWWRLGLPIMVVVVFLFIKMFYKWIIDLNVLHSTSTEDRLSNKIFANIVCTPGVIVLFAVSCMSGGWGISTMIPLGILWGVYRKLTLAYTTEKRSIQ